MKMLTVGMVVGGAMAGAVVGAVLAAHYTMTRSEASLHVWHWLDTAAVLANSDGSPKDAEQQRDSLNGNFVARTHSLAGALDVVADDDLRARVISQASRLAEHPESIADTPLTLGQRNATHAMLTCLAGLSEGESAMRCTNG